MAQGIPVIASDSVVGAMSLIEDNGKIFKTYDIEELSQDIDLCLEDDTNQKMSERSLSIIKNFTIENMVRLQRPTIDAYFAKEK